MGSPFAIRKRVLADESTTVFVEKYHLAGIGMGHLGVIIVKVASHGNEPIGCSFVRGPGKINCF